ncbi:hypothetical protein MMC11_006280 [Xylographa trunciseda]|nr:hypothetical protein [Xylographa trunciseda]
MGVPKMQYAATGNWEDVLDYDLYQSLRALQNRDFTYFMVSAALTSQNTFESRSELVSILGNDDPIKELDNINANKCEASAEAITDYNGAVEKEKDKNLSHASWELLLDDQEEIAIATVTKRIKEATAAAKDVIRTLPEQAQQGAANVFNSGSRFAIEVFETLCTQIAAFGGKIVEFMKKIFTALTNAYNTVKNAVLAGISAIFGRFAASNAVPIGPESAGDSFVGRVEWPPRTPVYVAAQECGAIADDIKDQGYTVYKSSFRGNEGGALTQCSLDFGKDETKHSELEVVWRRTVKRNSKTGFVPHKDDTDQQLLETNGTFHSDGTNLEKKSGEKRHRCRFQTKEEYLPLLTELSGREIALGVLPITIIYTWVGHANEHARWNTRSQAVRDIFENEISVYYLLHITTGPWLNLAFYADHNGVDNEIICTILAAVAGPMTIEVRITSVL